MANWFLFSFFLLFFFPFLYDNIIAIRCISIYQTHQIQLRNQYYCSLPDKLFSLPSSVFHLVESPTKIQSISIHLSLTLKSAKYAELKKRYLCQICLKYRSNSIIQKLVSWICDRHRIGNTFSQRLLFDYKQTCISPHDLSKIWSGEITT